MGWESLEDDKLCRLQLTAKIPKKISLVEKEVNDDGLLNAKEIAARVETSKSTVLSIFMFILIGTR